MAGSAKMRALEDAVIDAGGDDWLLEEIADGTPMWVLARRLSCSRSRLTNYLQHNPNREAAWRMALAASAHALIEDSVELADDVEPDRDQIAKAKLRIALRQWLAARRNRKDYGEDKTVTPVMHIGQLFLEAARERADSRALPGPTNETIVDAEVISETPALEDVL